MNNVIETAKDDNIDFMDTNISKKADIGRGHITLFAGPFLPILSGDYNIAAFETADFQEFTVIGTI
jgi:hypothetical protein